MPLQPKSTRYQPKVTARRCLTCQHPDREAIDYALTLGQRSYSDIAKEYSLTISNLYQHKRNHVATAIKEASAEYGIVDAKAILERIKRRSIIADQRFQADPDRIGHGRLAVEHDQVLLKATGNWRESRDITLGGSIQLSAADKADADYLAFMHERHPEQVAEYEQWAERRLLAEVQPTLLTTDSVQQHDEKLLEHACTEGET
jgi:hypothetical protein